MNDRLSGMFIGFGTAGLLIVVSKLDGFASAAIETLFIASAVGMVIAGLLDIWFDWKGRGHA